MRLICHRCQGELPAYDPTAPEPAQGYDTRAVLFCPHCSAPQLMLQDHMVLAETATPHAGPVPGAPPPPPHPHAVNWRVALALAGWLALGAAVLKTLAFAVVAAGVLGNIWVAAAAALAVALYAKRWPQGRMSAAIGARLGFATGLLMVAAMGLSFALAGVVARFGLHRMTGFDADLSQQFALFGGQMTASLDQQHATPDIRQAVAGMLAAPETRGGLALGLLGLEGLFVVSISAAGGAFSGMLRATWRRLPA